MDQVQVLVLKLFKYKYKYTRCKYKYLKSVLSTAQEQIQVQQLTSLLNYVVCIKFGDNQNA